MRPDTSGNLRDVSVPPLGDQRLDCGVNPRLVFLLREAVDREWERWPLEGEDRRLAESYCKAVKIVVTGGFTSAKIRQFEELNVPADVYGVGSWLLSSCDVCGTSNDFTADVVRVKILGTVVRPRQDRAQGLRQPADGAHSLTGPPQAV